MTVGPTIVFIEHVLWEPAATWERAVTSLADRFARSSPVDLELVRAAGALHDQLRHLAEWAAAAGVDLDRELGRWLDEHVSMHVRPDPAVTRVVRALAGRGPVHAASALPARAAESIARHAGCWRSFDTLHSDVRDASSLAEVVTSTGAEVIIAAGPTPMPDGLPRTVLGAPIAGA